MTWFRVSEAWGVSMWPLDSLQRKPPLDTTAVAPNGTQGGEMLWGEKHMLCGPEFTTATLMKVEGEAQTPQNYPLASTCTQWCTCTHTDTIL